MPCGPFFGIIAKSAATAQREKDPRRGTGKELRAGLKEQKENPGRDNGWNTQQSVPEKHSAACGEDKTDAEQDPGAARGTERPEKEAARERFEAAWRQSEALRLREELERREAEERRERPKESAPAEADQALEQAARTRRTARMLARRTRGADRKLAAQKKKEKQEEARRKARRTLRARRRAEGPAQPQGFFAALGLTLYGGLYLLGARVLRFFAAVRRRLRRFGRWLREDLPPVAERRSAIFRAKAHNRIRTVMFPYKYISRDTRAMAASVRARRAGEEGAPEYADAMKKWFRSLAIPLNHIANFFAPLIGVAILLSVVNTFVTHQFALAVDYSGERIGYVASETDFYKAQDTMLGRLINEDYVAPEDIIPTFTLTYVNKEEITDTETLSDKMVAASGNAIAKADGIYVGDEFLGAVENGDEFLLYLDGILSGYRTGEPYEVVQFAKKISVRSGVYPASSVLPLYQVKNTINATSATRENHYTVQSGDTISGIAAKYDTTTARILEYNPDIDKSYPVIYVGQEIQLSRDQVTSGLGIQVTRRETYVEDVPFSTTYVENNLYAEGTTVVISYGVAGTRQVTADVTYVDGEKTSVNELSSTPLTDPVAQREYLGTLTRYTAGADSNPNGFIWPVYGGAGKFNGSLYSYPGHTGMDIAVAMYTPVVAARSGTVEYATNYVIGSYGRQVLINHGNGVKTRYAHMSQVLVKAGQYVAQGTIIGKVGSSGNSTGPHLHFEIWINNRYVAPENYIGYYGR